MTTRDMYLSEMEDSGPQQQSSLVIRCGRDGSEFARLGEMLRRSAHLSLRASVLLLAVARFNSVPNRLAFNRGIWPILSRKSDHVIFETTGPSLWEPPEGRQQSGALIGMAEAAAGGVPWILERIARGSGEFVLLGAPSAIHDDGLTRRLYRAALPKAAARVHWSALTENLPLELGVAVDSFGAFGDLEAGLEFHGSSSRLTQLRRFLATDLAEGSGQL